MTNIQAVFILSSVSFQISTRKQYMLSGAIIEEKRN